MGHWGTAKHNHSAAGLGEPIPQASVSGLVDALGAKVATAAVGAASGVCGLDSGSKVPAANLPNSVMDYRGGWDVTTNTPTLSDATGNAGDVYLCSAAGTRNLGSGAITFRLGDYLIHSGSVWQLAGNINPVVSVNGATGAVSLGVDDLAGVALGGIVSEGDIFGFKSVGGWQNLDAAGAGLATALHVHTPGAAGAIPAPTVAGLARQYLVADPTDPQGCRWEYMGGGMDTIRLPGTYTDAQADTVLKAVGAGEQFVVTAISIYCSAANTVAVSAKLEFDDGTDAVISSHPGIAAGSGFVEGNGSGVLAVGAEGQDLLFTCSAPTTGSVTVQVSGYVVAV